ncbi:MAG: chemotaxis protein CheA [Amaricoccus sp.]|uniref:chemotaxis protein CheA n=1 Tax=Amaricoccus sp. TaxID=1872485 RepID=UPI0039E4BEBC
MDALDEIRALFLVECEEHLEALHEGFAALRLNPGDAEVIATVFRAVHSVKGGAAAFGLAELVEFAHGFESHLDDLRGGRVALTPAGLVEMVASADRLADLVAAARSDAASEPEPGSEPGSDQPGWLRVRFRPYPTLYERGHEPAVLLRALGGLGPMRTACNLRLVPGLEDLDPESVYLAWTVEIAAAGGEAAVREIFEFAEGDCELVVEPIAEPDGRPAGKADAAVPAAVAPAAQAPVVEAPVASPAAVAVPVAPAVPAATGVATPVAAPSPTVRVDLARVDRLINLVGELVISQSVLSQSLTEAGGAAAEGLDALRHLTREIQESVLAVRAQPLKPLFQRMARVVRDAATLTGKTVELVTSGELTEVDKTVIERLADPLTHMLRNAVDHGLEMPEARRAAGKPEVGTVRLAAEHRSGRVLIEIADDGAGIDRARVRAIAVERGLVPADAVLGEAEIDGLLFLPGFSTARQVSDLSGRGVGMDVVKASIAALGGRIVIASTSGRGTTFSISLPLTLAILDGMVVRAGGETLVVPLAVILEMLKPAPEQIHRIGEHGRVVQVRGEFLPVIDVAERLGFRGASTAGPGVVLVIETSDGERRALAVDAIEDQRQVVMKSLGSGWGPVAGVAAATILGNGRVALVLDTDALVDGTQTGPAPGALALAG